MSATIHYGPMGCGKTAVAVAWAREAASDLARTPYVMVASSLQVQAFQRRLAEAGGAMGIQVGTMAWFCRDCLVAAGRPPVVPPGEVLRRLMEAAATGAGLGPLAPLADKPGFWDSMSRLVAEAKAADITAEALARAAAAASAPARLRDLAAVYGAYEGTLRQHGWLDSADALRQAWAALRQGAVDVKARWPLVIVDGFDDLTPVQVALLRELGARTELRVLLPDDPDAAPAMYRRSTRTRHTLEQVLGVAAQSLSAEAQASMPMLGHLVHGLARREPNPVVDGEALALAECADRHSEVRTALRWLKARIVRDGVPADRAAIIMRNLEAYRPDLEAVAREFGLPLRLVGGLPLARSPVIQALLDLLRTQVTSDGAVEEPSLAPRLVLEAWRSPYFDWGDPAFGGSLIYLHELARRYRVIGGLSQWDEAFRRERRRLAREGADDAAPEQLELAQGAWERFVARTAPPVGRQPYRTFVSWLEDLIGPDPAARGRDRGTEWDADGSLGVVRRVRAALDDETAASVTDREAVAQDIAALEALKDILRAMVWVEEALGPFAIGYAEFVAQLGAAVRVARYRLPAQPDAPALLALDVAQARGVTFDVAAVIGLAEGEFPAVIHEDVFFTDADRVALAEQGLAFRPSTESYEAELLLVAVSRARRRLLLTRPRLADNGAPWEPSPYWEEVRGLAAHAPRQVGSELGYAPDEAASDTEALALLRPGTTDACGAWLEAHLPVATRQVRQAAERFDAQRSPHSSSDGDLSRVAAALAAYYGRGRPLSASRLETYAACPYRFYAQYVLHLEEMEPIEEGLDAAQLGNIYHRILAEAYAHPLVKDPAEVDQVLAALPAVLEEVLDAAPEEEGFRPTAWWRYTRDEIAQHVEASIVALAEMGAYRPRWFEQDFGRREMPSLVLRRGGREVLLSGVVDRIDVAPDGGLRIIDYKSASKSDYAKSALERGKKLQVALYALAARDALGLGEPVDGFYWHVRQAEPSGLQLARWQGGPTAAFEVAVNHTWRIVDGIHAGAFAPRPPGGGCPDYCPAVGYCWWYRPSGWGR